MQVTTIGMDLAKDVFQVHGITADGTVAFNRSIRRRQVLAFFQKLPSCLVGLEACGSAHHWARELTKIGHDVRLMPASYVKPYVKRGKTDAVDAEAICEAVTRPTMRFVPIKSEEQQAILSLHRTRALLVRQKTQMLNAIRGLLREFGHVVGNGPVAAMRLVKSCRAGDYPDIPDLVKDVLNTLCDQVIKLDQEITLYDKLIERHSQIDERAARLRRIPGVGPITASAIIATICDGNQFKNGREFAAWLGLTPLNRSSGGKERLGGISKKGDRYLRRLLVIGMTSQVQRARKFPERVHPWILQLLARKPVRLATVAMANKAARIIWAVLTSEIEYRHSRA
ncbi:MAG: IS110 family transposase [Pseudomonadota bacterium]